MDWLSKALLDDATATAYKSIMSIPGGLWRAQPGDRFGIGELAVHIRQSERFALKFLMSAAHGEHITLKPPFSNIVAIPDLSKRRRALSELNLQGARIQCAQFRSLSELQEWWIKDRTEVVQTLHAGIPDLPEIYKRIVAHPLVPNLTRSWIVMTLILFVFHPVYHAGQITESMKEGGYAGLVPFPFGDFEERKPVT